MKGKTMSQFLTPKQLVDRWNKAVTEGTLTNWRCQGVGPAYTKFGRNVRYPLAAVEQYEKANRIEPPANDMYAAVKEAG